MNENEEFRRFVEPVLSPLVRAGWDSVDITFVDGDFRRIENATDIQVIDGYLTVFTPSGDRYYLIKEIEKVSIQ